MIDDYKIKKAARQISEKVVDANGFDNSKPTHLAFLEGHIDGFNAGAKWMQEEFLKDLLHPASEVPRNDNGKILAFSKVNSNMNAMLYETACYTYQGKQEVRVREYTFTDLLFVEDLLDLIKKGGNHD